MEKLTYKDFKIGQKVTCVKLNDSRGITEDFYELLKKRERREKLLKIKNNESW